MVIRAQVTGMWTEKGFCHQMTRRGREGNMNSFFVLKTIRKYSSKSMENEVTGRLNCVDMMLTTGIMEKPGVGPCSCKCARLIFHLES